MGAVAEFMSKNKMVDCGPLCGRFTEAQCELNQKTKILCKTCERFGTKGSTVLSVPDPLAPKEVPNRYRQKTPPVKVVKTVIPTKTRKLDPASITMLPAIEAELETDENMVEELTGELLVNLSNQDLDDATYHLTESMSALATDTDGDGFEEPKEVAKCTSSLVELIDATLVSFTSDDRLVIQKFDSECSKLGLSTESEIATILDLFMSGDVVFPNH